MSLILALLVLFLSLHSCNARIFKVNHNHLAKKFQHYPINKVLLSLSLSLMKVMILIWDGVQENDGKLKHVLSEAEQKVKTVGNINAEIGKKEINVVIRDSSSSGSKKISFKVPQKKGGDEDKDFFIDYTPPRTHPPSHN